MVAYSWTWVLFTKPGGCAWIANEEKEFSKARKERFMEEELGHKRSVVTKRAGPCGLSPEEQEKRAGPFGLSPAEQKKHDEPPNMLSAGPVGLPVERGKSQSFTQTPFWGLVLGQRPQRWSVVPGLRFLGSGGWLVALLLLCGLPGANASGDLAAFRTGPSGLPTGTAWVMPWLLELSHGACAAAVELLRCSRLAAAWVPWQNPVAWLGVLSMLVLGAWFALGFLGIWPYKRGLTKPRICGKRRLSCARAGWRHRHMIRCSGSAVPRSGNAQAPLTVNEEFFHIDAECFAQGLCRGGAVGSQTTARKRNERQQFESELLANLTALIQKFDQGCSDRSAPGDPDRNIGKGKGDSLVPRLATDVGLLNALQRLVTRATKKPEGLLGRLKDLVLAAERAASVGGSLNPSKHPPKPVKTAGANPGKSQGKTKSPQADKGFDKGKSKGVDSVVNNDANAWTTVGRNGKPLNKDKGKGKTAKGKDLGSTERVPQVWRLREQDWSTSVVVQKAGNFGAWVDKLGTGKPFAILTQTPEELASVLGIVKGDKAVRASVILPCDTRDHIICSDFPDEKFTYQRHPMWDGSGKVVTKHVAMWSNLHDTSKPKFQVGIPADKRPSGKRPDSIVLRVTADARFSHAATWRKMATQKENFLRSWIRGVAPTAVNLVLDTWSWEFQTGAAGAQTVIKGLLRVKKDAAVGTLLTGSGKLFEDKRFFLEPLDWTGTPAEGWGKQPFIKWLDKERNESDLEYASRAAGLGGTHGIAKGWRQLGLRSMKPFEDDKPKTRVWILKNCPRFWDLLEIEPFLESSGFQTLDFLSKKRDRLGTSWIFRGSRADAETYLQLFFEGEAGDSSGKFLVCEIVTRDRRNATNTKLQSETRVSLKPTKVFDLTKEDSDEAMEPEENVPGTQLDGEEDKKDEDMKQEGEAEKRAATPGVSPQKKKVKRTLPALPPGVTKIPNAGQGNCLFEAIAQGVERVGGGTFHHRAVRAAAVAHLQKHKEKYLPFWDQRNTEDEMVADGTLAGFESYIQQVSEVNQYAGNLEITALASTMDRPITVVQAEGPVHTFNSSGASRGIYLFYGSSHYELLECTAEAKFALHTKALPAKTSGGRESSNRGGGKAPSLGGHTAAGRSLGGHTAVTRSSQRVVQTQKKALGSRASGQAAGSIGGLTRRSFVTSKGQKKQHSPATKAMTAKDSIGALKVGSLPAAQPSVGGLTRKTLVLKPSKQGHKSLASGSFCGDRDSATKSSRSKGLSAVPSKQLVKSFSDGIALKGNRRDPKDIWTCPHEGCGVTFRKGEKQRSLTSLRAAHLAKFHPDIPRSKNDHMREYAPPVLASASIPESERDWSCPWCPAGLPFLPKSDKTKAVTHHYATKHPKRDTSAGKSNSVRAALARKGSAKASKYLQGKKTLGDKLRKRASERRNWNSCGHQLVEVPINWSHWPRARAKAASTRKGDTLLTCQTCRMVSKAAGKFFQCKQRLGSASSAQASLWERLAQAPDIRLALSQAWGCTVEEATAWTSSGSAAWRKSADLKGHEFQEFKVDWSKCPLKGKTNRGKMITCVNCRVIWRTPGVLTPCKGSDSVPHKGTVATWRKLKGSEVQKQLLRLWNISLKDANKFFQQETHA